MNMVGAPTSNDVIKSDRRTRKGRKSLKKVKIESVSSEKRLTSELISDVINKNEQDKTREKSLEDEEGRSRRKNALIETDSDEIKKILKILGPIYRRRIFLEQLKARWYLIAVPSSIFLLLAVLIPIIILPMLAEEIVVEKFRAKQPISVILKVMNIDGLDLSEAARDWPSLEARAWADRFLLPNLTEMYTSAKFSLKNLSITNLELETTSSKFQKRSLSSRAPVIIHHLLHLSEQNNDVGVESLENLVRNLRKSLVASSVWKIDPKMLIFNQGNVTVRAASTQNFLASSIPPLDLFTKNRINEIFHVSRKTSNCSKLYIPEGGSVEPYACKGGKEFQPNTICSFTCNSSFVFIGPTHRVCFSNGVWSGENVECAKTCPPLNKLRNGFISPSFCTNQAMLMPNKRCFHFCKENFLLVGSLQRVCQDNGEWSSTAPVCKRTCPPLKPPFRGHIEPINCYDVGVKEGEICSFACEESLVLHGDTSTTCDSSGKWTKDVPVCRQRCKKLSPILNSVVHPDTCRQSKIYEGTPCTYTCLNGFRLVGPSVWVCDPNGDWIKPAPSCVRTCSALGDFQNGIIIPISCSELSSGQGQICKFSCENGYLLKGAQDLTCTSNGEWEDDIPKCIARCSLLQTSSNGYLSCTGDTSGSTCVLYCYKGYRMQGSSYVLCQDDGSWSEPLGVCKGTCVKLIPPDNGDVTPSSCKMIDSIIGDICTFSCRKSYGLAGSKVRTCLENSTWSGIPATCNLESQYRLVYEFNNEKICLTMDGSYNYVPVKKSLEECVHNSASSWSITKNKQIKNSQEGLCLSFSQLSPLADLILSSCSNSDQRQIWEWPVIAGKQHTLKLHGYDLYLVYGYTTASGLLSAKKPTPSTRWLIYEYNTLSFSSFYGVLHSGRCPRLPALSNGRWTPTTCQYEDVTSGDRCSFLCLTGHEVGLGESTVVCVNGLWEGNESPNCVPSCVAFNEDLIQNGSATPSYCTSNSYVNRGSVCSFHCDEGYELHGEKNSVCLEHGEWSGEQPECLLKCGPLTIPSNGYISTTATCSDPQTMHRLGELCIRECNVGYLVEGSLTTSCQADGSWSVPSHTCTRACHPPAPPVNGFVECNEGPDRYPTGTSCNFTCSGSRSLWPSDDDVTTCLSTGVWDTDTPHCQHFCSPLSPPSNGNVKPAICMNQTNKSHHLPNKQKCHFSCRLNYFLLGSLTTTCLENGEWSNLAPTCEDDRHFMIKHQSSLFPYSVCIIARYYEYNNISHVSKQPLTQCNHSNPKYMWSMTQSNQLRNVDAGRCLGVSVSEEFQVLQLLNCDSSDLNQRWECQVDSSKTILKLKTTSYVAYSGAGPSLVIRRRNHLKPFEMEFTSFRSIDTSGQEGTICGIMAKNEGECPQFVTQIGATLRPPACYNSVKINTNCSLLCDTGYELSKGSGATTSNLHCGKNGMWNTWDIQCKKRKCKKLKIPPDGNVDNAMCRNSTFTAWSSITCIVSCAEGFYTKFIPGNTGNLRCIGNGVWSEELPECLHFCESLRKPNNGQVQPKEICTKHNGSKHGDICHFSCPPDHRLSGSEYLKCDSGSWNSSAPQCTPYTNTITCRPPPTPNYGRILPSSCTVYGTSVNKTCAVECISGFGLSPAHLEKVLCRGDGTWSSKFPICKKVCPNIIAPMHSLVVPERCTDGNNVEHDECKVVCNKAYAVIGNPIVTCLWNGQWDKVVSECEQSSQFLLQNQEKCVTALNNTDKQIIIKRCNSDDSYQRWEWLNNSHIRNVGTQKCMIPQTIESYSNIILISCNSALYSWECPYKRGFHQELLYKHLNLAHARDVNHLFVTDQSLEESNWADDYYSIKFLAVGKINGTACRFRSINHCAPLPDILNGSSDSGCNEDKSEVFVGKRCSYHCDVGYKLVGQAKRHCKQDGSWNDTEDAFCKRICPALPPIRFGSISPFSCFRGQSEDGAVCRFQCEDDYLLSGSSERFCLSDGTWSAVPVICHKNCPSIDISGSLKVNPQNCAIDNQAMGATCSATCSNGFILIGSSTRTCLADGSWTGGEWKCHRSCPSLTPISNGKVLPTDCIGNNKKEGDACVFSCKHPYGIDGTNIRSCISEGVWTREATKCLRICSGLNPPTNGFINCSSEVDLAGNVCKYHCDIDFVIDGPTSERKCLSTGVWSGTQPTCAREQQFILFQISLHVKQVCLHASNSSDVTMIEESNCIFNNPNNLWAWHHEGMLRNVYYRRCLTGKILQARSHLILKECNDTDLDQKWECPDSDRSWYIRLSSTSMYPLFSLLSSSKVLLFTDKGLQFLQNKSLSVSAHMQWFARTTIYNRKQVCSAKRIDFCSTAGKFSNVEVSYLCSKYLVPVGTQCILRCKRNFMLSSPISTITCVGSGHWSHDIPTCVPACSPFRISNESRLKVSPSSCGGKQQLQEGFACTFSCIFNSVLDGDPVLTCMGNDRWNFNSPICKATCPSVNLLAHGIIFPSLCHEVSNVRIIEGTKCDYKCLQSELALNGETSRVCTHEGKWSSPEPRCVKPCPPHPPLIRGSVLPPSCTTSTSLADHACVFTCESGLIQHGALLRLCQDDGTWSGIKSDCRLGCSPLRSVFNAEMKPIRCLHQSIAPGYACSLTCNPGYDLKGEGQITCLDDGNWSGRFGKCIRKCGKLLKPRHGEIIPLSCLGGDLYAGHECLFACQPSYILQGSALRFCLDNGTWSGKEATCHLACPALPSVENISYEPVTCDVYSQLPGASCKATCKDGTISRQGHITSTITCGDDGEWNNDVDAITGCYANCQTPKVENGEMLCETLDGFPTNVFTTETVCHIKCFANFIPTTSSYSTCTATAGNVHSVAMWTPYPTTCIFEPDPMIIINREKFSSVCFGVFNRMVILVEWQNCHNASLMTRWVWHDSKRIRNVNTGLCMSVSEAEVNTYITMSPCNSTNLLQEWTCSRHDPYILLLLGTGMGINTSLKKLDGVVLTNQIDSSSKLYTYNPNSKNHVSTLCSKREDYACQTPELPRNAEMVSTNCTHSKIRIGRLCSVLCVGNLTRHIQIRCESNGLWSPGKDAMCSQNCDQLPALDDLAAYEPSVCQSTSIPALTVCSVKCRTGYHVTGPNTATTCLRSGQWQPIKYKCLKTCREIRSIENGRLQPSTCRSGKCLISCHPGYRAEGPTLRQCLETGQWSNEMFLCLPEVRFAVASEKTFKGEQLCLNVSESRVYKEPCQTNKLSQLWRWSTQHSILSVFNNRCLSIDMTSSEMNAFLATARGRSSSNTIITDFIHERDSESDVTTKECDSADKWQQWKCGDVTEIEHSRLQLASLPYQLASDPIFRPILRVESRTNFTSSKWNGKHYSGSRHVCAFRKTGICPSLWDVHGGTVLPRVCKTEFVLAGTHCRFTCHNGFTMEGDDTTICTENGIWSKSPPVCIGMSFCAPVMQKKHLSFSPSFCTEGLVPEGYVCHSECSENTVLKGEANLQCDLGGLWKGNAPSCEITCPALYPPQDGAVFPEHCEYENIQLSTVCNFSCRSGFSAFGDVTKRCSGDGTWSGEHVVCKQLCPKLYNPSNGLITPSICLSSSSSHGNTCHVTCYHGYALVGKATLKCKDGHWSSPLPTCSPDQCERLVGLHIDIIRYDGIQNGAIKSNTAAYITCRRGYQVSGPPTRVCLENGSWVGGSNTCHLVKCPFIGRLYHGNIKPLNCSHEDGVSPLKYCYFSCDHGYLLAGPSSKRCQFGGIWSDNTPVQCKDTRSKSHFLKFLIIFKHKHQVQDNNPPLCLAVHKDEKSLNLHECEENNPYQLWRWFGSFRVQSFGNQLCLKVLNNQLAVGTCMLNDTSQHISCDNIDLDSVNLRLKIGDLFLGKLVLSKTIEARHVEWAGRPVIYSPSKLISIKNTMESNPICNFMCGGNVMASEGHFSTPNFPDIYPENVHCIWIIHLVNPGQEIIADFSRLSLKQERESPTCSSNYLTIFEGSTSATKRLKRICKSTVSFRVTSLHGMLRVEFRSDHQKNENGFGFSARWYSRIWPKPPHTCASYNGEYPMMRRGDASDVERAPWQSLVTYKQHVCNGFIINNRFVITAANCIDKFDDVITASSMSKVVLIFRFKNQKDLIKKKQKEEFYEVRKIWRYPDYDDTILRDDIALVMSQRDITFDDVLHPVCLPDPKVGNVFIPELSLCWAVQWSRDMFSRIASEWEFSRYSAMKVLSNQKCSKQVPELRTTKSKLGIICAQTATYQEVDDVDLGTKSIPVDSGEGSLLQCKWNDHWYLIGVQTFAFSRIRHTFVFTDVIRYHAWISDVMTNAFYYLRDEAIK